MGKKRTFNQNVIRESLIKQLAFMGAHVDHYEDLVNKYIEFWAIEKKLTADINKRGVVFTDKSSVGVPMMKNNPSVKEKVMVNRQMLQILKDLGLSTENAIGEEGDDPL